VEGSLKDKEGGIGGGKPHRGTERLCGAVGPSGIWGGAHTEVYFWWRAERSTEKGGGERRLGELKIRKRKNLKEKMGVLNINDQELGVSRCCHGINSWEKVQAQKGGGRETRSDRLMGNLRHFEK